MKALLYGWECLFSPEGTESSTPLKTLGGGGVKFERSSFIFILNIANDSKALASSHLTKQPMLHPELLPPYSSINPSSGEKGAFYTSNAVLGPVKLYTKKLSTESKKKCSLLL